MYLDSVVKLLYLRSRMPRVVMDQRGKFNSDELFASLSRPSEVRYTDFPSGSDDERRQKFLQDCSEGHIDIAYTSSGFNLELHISSSVAASVDAADPSFTSDKADKDSEPPKVHICSHFILNGVCVRWKGYIDRVTLKGVGCLEFDEQRASVEEQRLRREWAALDDRFGVPPPTTTTNGSGEASSSTGHSSTAGSRPGGDGT